MTIIKDKSKLSKYVTETLAQYISVGDRVHVAFISSLYHAATTGYVETLNTLIAGLRSNDQTALKMYVRRAAAIVGLGGENPDGKDSEVVIAAVEAGGILGVKTKNGVPSFYILEGRGHNSEPAKALAKLCVSRFIDPKEENGDRKVLERNNFAEVKTLGDMDILKAVAKALNSVNSTSETKKVHVSQQTAAFLEELRGKVEVRMNQLSLAKATQTETPVAA